MVSAIDTLPTPKDFGKGFNYEAWTPGTEVMLCNVPWNSDYRDIVKFENSGKLDEYLNKRTGVTQTIRNMTYAAFGRPVQLDLPYNYVNQYNYMRVSNPAQPNMYETDLVKNFYYFVIGVEYVAPNTTRVYLQLDVWQTFGDSVRFGNCYFERGHIGVANANGYDPDNKEYGRSYLTQPEGLDVGSEYQIMRRWDRIIASARVKNPTYDILVYSSVSLTGTFGTVEKPEIRTAKGSFINRLPNGAEAYIFPSLMQFQAFLEAIADKPWIGQGIMSITAIPNIKEYGMELNDVSVAGVGAWTPGVGQAVPKKNEVAEHWRDHFYDLIPQRYRHLKKFRTFPYSLVELTSYNGTPLVIKPEVWIDDHATVVETVQISAPSPRIVFYPFRYNAGEAPVMFKMEEHHGEEIETLYNDGAEFLDMSTGIYNLPTFSIVNDAAISYMASNANSIAFQHASADWSQQRALASNELQAGNATAGINASQAQNSMQTGAMRQQTTLANDTAVMQGLQGAVTGAMGAAGQANPLGVISSIAGAAATAGININRNEQSNSINTGLSQGMNASQTGLAGSIRDSNKAYGDFAANGDYDNAIRGINAKVQDAKMIQPTTSGQMGGESFNLANYHWGYDLKLKTIQPSAMRAIGEIWLRYGYQVNQFGRMPESLMVMTHATYWKLRETYITSSVCPENFRQTIRGIFEKGVTVWADPEDIGFLDFADNEPLEGVYL